MPSTHWNRVSPEDIRRGREIKRLREDAGVSARQVGENAGLSAQYLYMIENGHRAAPTKTCRKIAKALNVDPDAIIVPNYRDPADDADDADADQAVAS